MARARVVLAVAAVLGRLPAPVLTPLGWAFGLLVVPFLGARRKVVARNIRACFPERGGLWRLAVRIAHYAMLGRFVLDHSLLLASSEGRLKRLVRVEGLDRYRALEGEPVILAAPHFLGLDLGSVRVQLERPMAAVYAPQGSEAGERVLLRCRTRLAKRVCLLSNRARGSMAQAQKILADGGVLYHLGDMDMSRRARHLFLPFLGVDKAATMTVVPRLARLSGARVMPCVTVARPLGGYLVKLGEPWQDFPSGDDEADMRRYNEFVGDVVREHPTQYYWPHRRFKMRPQGEAEFYA